MHLNIRSIRNKIVQAKLELGKNDIDILLFSETWLNDTDDDSLYEFPRYNMYRLDRVSIYRGGGLCAHVDESISCSADKFKFLNRGNENIEVQWLLSVKGNSKRALICNVYRPPSGSLIVFCDTLKALFLQIDNIDSYDIFVIGDFNVNTLLNSADKELLYETMIAFNFSQLIHEVTTTSGTNTCIDLIFTNCFEINSSGVLNVHISDHLPVHVIREHQHVKNGFRKFKGRSYRNFEMDNYLTSLENCNWTYFDECNNSTECWDIYENMLKRMLDVVCPVREFKVKDKPDPWMTNYLIERVNDKNTSLKEARNSLCIIAWNRARILKNIVNNELESAKAKYYSELCDENINDSKKFWSILKDIIPSKNSGKKPINLTDENGVSINIEDTAGHINSFFAEVGPRLAENHQLPFEFKGVRCEVDMPDLVFSDDDIVKCIKDLDVSKSSAIEYLPTYIFRAAVLHNPQRFIKIINLCIDSGKIPDVWKIATVTPLPKGGNLTNVSNFRPISVLPVPGKVLERLIHTAISTHLEVNNILSKFQGGYQKGKSTLDSISIFVDDIQRNRNKGNISMAAFIDIKKAFDSVNYIILIKKLEQYGIRNRSLTLIENYLSKRQQCTVANNTRSSMLSLSCGVPQGSILGPLFFLLYINDCTNLTDDHITMLYADDSVLYVSGKDINTLTERLSVALNSFYIWASTNKLTMNESKTKIMTFASSKKLNKIRKPKISLNGEDIKSVLSYKYLGVTLDQELNFAMYVRNMIKRLRFKSILLYRSRKYMSKPVLLRVYKSHVLPVIDYCDILYAGTNVVVLDTLQRVQNKCLKTCMGMHILTATEKVHADAKMPTLENRRKYHIKLYGYKRAQNPKFLEHKTRTTRLSTAPLLKYSKLNCAAYRNCPEVLCAQTWNSLKPNLRNIDDFSEFKNLAKTVLLDTIPKQK